MSDQEANETNGDPYRNPEPPTELRKDGLINADNVGNTVFSKHWVFTTLMRLIKMVETHEKAEPITARRDPATGAGDISEDVGLEINDELQDDLCKVWDMSMNPEVVKFLQEFQSLDILTAVIAKCRAPRATEICVGILGNMACDKQVSLDMANNMKLVNILLLLFEEPDPPTLIELTRLLHACVSTEGASNKWLNHIRQQPALFTHLSFILQSSTNNDLILSTADLLDKLMDMSEVLSVLWSTAETALCCLEASKQVGGESGIENVDIFLHILQLLSTCEAGVEALLSYGTELLTLCLKYLRNICNDEVVGIEGKESTIASAFSVINVLLASWEDRTKFIQEDYELMRCVLKILEEVFPHYNKARSRQLRRMRSRSVSASHSSPPRSVSSSHSAALSDSHVHLSNSAQRLSASSDNRSPLHTSHDDQSLDVSSSIQSDLNSIAEQAHPSCDTNKLGECVSRQSRYDGKADSATQLQDSRDTSTSSSCYPPDTATHTRLYHMLYDVMQSCVTEIISVLYQILSSRISQTDDVDTLGVPECLDYLDTKCPSTRIQYMIHMVQSVVTDSESHSINLFNKLQTIIARYRLKRLESLISSSQS